MKSSHHFIRRARVLSRVMTSNSNVQVTISGDTAYQEPGHINIPSGDFSDPDWVNMVLGWIDHELGHEKHTIFACFLDAKDISPFLTLILNTLEDIRMEAEVSREFDGAKVRLTTLVELVMKHGLFEIPSDHDSELSAFHKLCMYWGRFNVTGQACLSEYARTAEVVASKKLGTELVSAIINELKEVEKATNTWDCLAIAKNIFELLKSAQDDGSSDGDSQDKPQNNGSEESGSDHSQENNQSEASGNEGANSEEISGEEESNQSTDSESKGESSTDVQADEPENGTSDLSQDDALTDEFCNSDEASCDGASDQDTNSDANESSADDAGGKAQDKSDNSDGLDEISNLLNASIDDLEYDFHDEIREFISTVSEEAIESNGELNLSSYPIVKSDGRCLSSECPNISLANTISGQLYRFLHKVIIDETQSQTIYRNIGTKLVGNRLHGVAVGNFNVFEHTTNEQEVSAAVTVITDASQSMDDLMSSANTATLAFAKALERVNIPSEIHYYGHKEPYSKHDTLVCAKSFSERSVSDRRFYVSTAYSTPTAEAIVSACQNLVLREEQKKFLFVITDGDPDCASAVSQAAQLAKDLGILIIPIGLGVKRVKGFDDGEFIVVDDIEKLTATLNESVAMNLFK